MFEIILVFLLGIGSSFLSAIAGGGSGLITAPFFIFLGLSPQAAIATSKLASVGLGIGSLGKFVQTNHVQWKYTIILSIISIPAAVIGATLLVSLDSGTIGKTLAVVMLISLPLSYIKKDYGLVHHPVTKLNELWGYISYFIMRVLQSAMSGLGSLNTLLMMKFFGLTILEVQATKRIPGFVVAVIVFVIFLANNIIDIKLGSVALVGMIIGSYAGTHLAIKKGNAWVKSVFSIFIFILALSLLIK